MFEGFVVYGQYTKPNGRLRGSGARAAVQLKDYMPCRASLLPQEQLSSGSNDGGLEDCIVLGRHVFVANWVFNRDVLKSLVSEFQKNVLKPSLGVKDDVYSILVLVMTTNAKPKVWTGLLHYDI